MAKFLVVSDLRETEPFRGYGPSSAVQSAASRTGADAVISCGNLLEDVPWSELETITNYRTVLDNLTDGSVPVFCLPGPMDGVTHEVRSANRYLGIPYSVPEDDPLGRDLTILHEKALLLEGSGKFKDVKIGAVPGGITSYERPASIGQPEDDFARSIAALGKVDVLVTNVAPKGVLDAQMIATENWTIRAGSGGGMSRFVPSLHRETKFELGNTGSQSLRESFEYAARPSYSLFGGASDQFGTETLTVGPFKDSDPSRAATVLCVNAAYSLDKSAAMLVDTENKAAHEVALVI